MALGTTLAVASVHGFAPFYRDNYVDDRYCLYSLLFDAPIC